MRIPRSSNRSGILAFFENLSAHGLDSRLDLLVVHDHSLSADFVGLVTELFRFFDGIEDRQLVFLEPVPIVARSEIS